MSSELTGLFLLRSSILVYLSSMIPFIAARGAIILAAALKVPWFLALLLSTAGSFTVMSLLLRIDRAKFEKLRRYKLFNAFFDAVDRRVEKHGEAGKKRVYVSLATMVALPFTGVGIPAACVLAKIMDLDYDPALLAILIGTFFNNAITTAGIYGLLTGLRTLLEALL